MVALPTVRIGSAHGLAVLQPRPRLGAGLIAGEGLAKRLDRLSLAPEPQEGSPAPAMPLGGHWAERGRCVGARKSLAQLLAPVRGAHVRRVAQSGRQVAQHRKALLLPPPLTRQLARGLPLAIRQRRPIVPHRASLVPTAERRVAPAALRRRLVPVVLDLRPEVLCLLPCFWTERPPPARGKRL